MRAIILAAGRGSRMGQMTRQKPKCLTMLAGKSLLEWQIKALTSAGITEIGIVTGYLANHIQVPSAHYFHNSRWNETNMVFSLETADIWLRTSPVIVSYGDIFYSSEPIETLINTKNDIALAYDPNWLNLWEKRFGDPLVDAETFRVNSDNILEDIGQTPKTVSQVEGQFMGLLHFKPRGWLQVRHILEDLCTEKRETLDSTGLLRLLILQGQRIAAIPSPQGWGEVDSENDLHTYQTLLEQGMFPWMR